MNTIVQKINKPTGVAIASFFSLFTFGYIIEDLYSTRIRHITNKYEIHIQQLEQENTELKSKIQNIEQTKYTEL